MKARKKSSRGWIPKANSAVHIAHGVVCRMTFNNYKLSFWVVTYAFRIKVARDVVKRPPLSTDHH